MNPSLLYLPLSNQSAWVLIKTYKILGLLNDEKRLTLELKSDSPIVFSSHVGLSHRKVLTLSSTGNFLGVDTWGFNYKLSFYHLPGFSGVL